MAHPAARLAHHRLASAIEDTDGAVRELSASTLA